MFLLFFPLVEDNGRKRSSPWGKISFLFLVDLIIFIQYYVFHSTYYYVLAWALSFFYFFTYFIKQVLEGIKSLTPGVQR